MKFKDIEEGKTRAIVDTKPELGEVKVIRKESKSGVVLIQRKDGKRQYINAGFLREVKEYELSA